MLDQNTDRMWYVIGAVIVGAALILLMNGAFPKLFASVGETFQEKTEEVTEMTDGIMPMRKTDGINLLKYGHLEVPGAHGINDLGEVYRIMTDSQIEYARAEDLAPLFDERGLEDSYTLTFELKSKDTSQSDKIRVYMLTSSSTKYGFVDTYVTVSEEYQTYTIRGLRPTLNNATVQTAHLSFYGTYGTGNVPVFRNIRLEKEL